ncbi:hypothetical protein H5410_045353 [Solanum commersonii]|uniref:Uncharacterized protein n=1 Tax=Solanum commersonii TaxID=4109 RepID=A0A9J5XBC7_SOLCO|nr:hypothetical protein H5410_045353 [Solanum commersonii]
MKIKEWESKTKEETKSFWMMRNDFKREKKLPGFFDKQVFDILDHGNGNAEGLDLAFVRDVPQMNEDAIPMQTSKQPHSATLSSISYTSRYKTTYHSRS